MARIAASLGLGLALVPAACGGTAPSSPPPPASQVSGYVDDTAFKAMSNATVEVLDGPQAGSSTLTDATGRFTLSGQFDQATRFRARKDGYHAAIETRQLTPLVFFLGVDGPSGNMATLTVEADASCTTLPDYVRTRTYPAIVTASSNTQNPNMTFNATLSGASLDSYYHFVLIEVIGDLIRFDLSDNGIEEEVAPEAYLYVGGVASTHAEAGATVSAPLTTGLIDYCVLKSDPGSAYPCTNQALERVQCQSPKNRLTLTWQ